MAGILKENPCLRLRYTILSLSLLIGCCSCSNVDSTNSGKWKVWVEDGKTQQAIDVKNIASDKILDSYFETLRRICDWNVCTPGTTGTMKDRDPYQPVNLKVTKIGKWGAYEVFDVTNKEIRHKSIVLRDTDGKYRILYLQFNLCTADVNDFAEIKGPILTYRTRIPGNGGFYIEYYFKVDKITGNPVRLNVVAIK